MTSDNGAAGSWLVFVLSAALLLPCSAPPVFGSAEGAATVVKETTGRSEEAAAEATAEDARTDERLGVQTMCTNCNEANLDLGGLDDAHIGVVMDGFRLSGGLPRIYAFAILPQEVIANLDVVPGPGQAAHSPEAVGGCVTLTSREPERKPSGLLVGEGGSFGWSKFAAMVDGSLGAFSGRVVATRSASNAIDADGDGNVETGETEQVTALAELSLNLRRAGRLTVGGTWITDDQIDGHGEVIVDLNTHEPIGYRKEDTFVDWNDTRVGYDIDLAPGHTLQLRVSRLDREQRIFAPISSPEKEERYFIDQQLTHTDLRWRGSFGTRWLLSAAVDSDDDRVSITGAALPSYQRRAEEKVERWGGHLQAEIALLPTLALTVGSRYDELKMDSGEATAVDLESGTLFDLLPITRDKWSPRVALTWKPSAELMVKGSAGYGFSPPKPVFTEICCGQSPETNAGLEPERSRVIALDLTYQASPDLKFNLYTHRSDFDNYLIKLVANSVGLKQKLKQANIKDVTLTGISGFVNWKSGRGFSVSASYTHLDAQNNGESVDLLVYPNSPVPLLFPISLPIERIPYIARNSGQISTSYQASESLSLAASAQYTGSMLIQHYDYVSFTPLPPGGLREDLLQTEGFWVVNLSGTLALNERIDLHFGIDNLTDKVQTDLDDFTTDYNWGPIRGLYGYAGLSYRF